MSDKTARVVTYGCQQNENDSERIRGMLLEMGYILSDSADADVVIFNTCAVRDNAEKRVYGNIGALKAFKDKKPGMLIGICGCMAQQQHVAQHVKKRFPFVDFVFGTGALHRLPQILYSAEKQRVFDTEMKDGEIVENLPHNRQSTVTATVSVMYGCNNFCTYCVVPHVRGRERSREPGDILREVEGLAAQGCREVTLLGQNVNSYQGIGFPELLERVSKVDGIGRVRFISSHPKDISDALIGTMANNPKICNQLHLPFQAGSNRVLTDMNRRYTREQYLDIIGRVKGKMPDVALTSDIIVGFPTETEEDFAQTLDLVREVEFDMLFTFIYSKRKGTPAEKLPPALTEAQIKANFDRLVAVQNAISLKKNKALESTVQRVLVEGYSKSNESALTGRTEGAKIVNFIGDKSLIGEFAEVRITHAATWSLTGEIV